MKPKHLAQLRKEAEALATPTTGGPVELADVDRARLVHELQTHQIELELQNDQLREAQLELVQSHNLFSDLYNFAPIGYITLDRGLQIARANLRASELLGVDRRELVGSWFRRFVSSKDQDTYYHNIQKQPEFVTPQELELRLLKSDGTTFHARLEITASRESEGEQAHCLIAISDLSAQKKAESDRFELEQQLQQTQRLESLGVLAGGIAHDFNNLLTTILLESQLVSKQLSTDSNLLQHTTRIAKAANRSAELCHQLLAYAGKGSFEETVIDVTEFLCDMQELLKTSVAHTAELRFDLNQELPPVAGGITQLRQVMMNLVINASEAMVDGLGIVTVRSGVWDPPEQSTAATGELEFEKEDYVFIEVSDTGKGIPRSDLDRICEPFYSTKFTGRGLGLSVVSGIVRSHHGAMEIESDIGKGTTFRIILPAADQPPTPMKNENENSSVGSIDDASSQTILVVDDEENVRATMRVLLEFYKYNVLTAPNGETAIDTVQAFDGQISLVLLDLTMPGIGAPEIVAKIGAIQPGIPVVLMSGYSRDDVADQMKELGAAAFLPKPSTAVRSTVREVLQRQHVKPTNS